MNTAEKIFQEVRQLPEADAQKVLCFLAALRVPKDVPEGLLNPEVFRRKPPWQPSSENDPTLAHLPPQATQEMLARRKQALEELRVLGGLSDVISDPLAWQREIRVERALPEIR